MNHFKPVKDEKTEHLLWFVENGFHQLTPQREFAKKELEARGIDMSKLRYRCFCNQCKEKKAVKV